MHVRLFVVLFSFLEWSGIMGRDAREIVLLSRARQLLAEARTIDELKDVRDLAELARGYAKKKGLAQEIIVEASAIKVEAERKLGQLLKNLPLANSSSGNQYTGKLDRSPNGTGPIRLRDVGVSKSESSRAQRIASLPRAKFNRYVKENIEAGREPTVAGALRLVREMEVAESVNHHTDLASGVVGSLDELIEQGRTFGTVYADPPWKYGNQGTRSATNTQFPTMTVAEICDLPVAQVLADRAHLHLWVTDGFLREAFDVIDAWGFEYAGSSFVWVKPQMGLGNYWRKSHETLLLACRKNIPFRQHGQRSWLEHDRTKHSKKPDVVREIIQKVSPGPYLEMFSRTPPVNSSWTVFGNQVAESGTT